MLLLALATGVAGSTAELFYASNVYYGNGCDGPVNERQKFSVDATGCVTTYEKHSAPFPHYGVGSIAQGLTYECDTATATL